MKKPALKITKKDGEYTVQMEVMKPFDKERLPHQYPYENKDPLLYTVGRTEKENARRKLMKERRQRRLDRQKRKYIQSTFKNMCGEICQKKFEECIGILPNQDANYPICPCEKPLLESESEDTCSCDEAGFTLTSSESDNDEWTVEFTPPYAKYNPDYKSPPPTKTSECQYNYLDFRVEIFDRKGQPVPRFFKGPDGKEQCSDLGGFYGPDGKWLVIGEDGFIAPDGRWCPMTFIGPDGLAVNAEEGFFVDASGKTYTVGVDGYVNSKGVWVSFVVDKPAIKLRKKESEESMWTCLGNVKVDDLIRRNFLPHNSDKRVLQERLNELGLTDKMPTGKLVPRFREEPVVQKKPITETENQGKTRRGSQRRDGGGPKGQAPESGRQTKSGGGQKSVTVTVPKPGDAGGKSGTKSAAAGVKSGTKTVPAGSKSTAAGNKTATKGSKSAATPNDQGDGKKQGKSREKSPSVTLGSRPGSPGYEDPYKKMIQKAMKEKKKMCLLARMRGEGRNIPRSHLECFGDLVGGACIDRGGICTGVLRDSSPGTESDYHSEKKLCKKGKHK